MVPTNKGSSNGMKGNTLLEEEINIAGIHILLKRTAHDI